MPDDTSQDPDRSEPSPERKAYLESKYQANIAANQHPYEKVEIHTLEELNWIFDQRHWSGKDELPPGSARPDLTQANLRNANLSNAILFEANLSNAILFEANLSDASLSGANLSNAHLYSANLSDASLSGANLSNAHLYSANLIGADLNNAYLSGTDLSYANLSDADLSGANLSGADLSGANLSNAYLYSATFDASTNLANITLSDQSMFLADVTWGGANLVSVDWSPVHLLADEMRARRPTFSQDDVGVKIGVQKIGDRKPRDARLSEWRAAVRAYRLLATALRAQAMNEDADRFAYRAQVCQRQVLRYQRKWRAYLGSAFLDILAGYGYRPGRSFVAYGLVIFLFAAIYFVLGLTSHPLTPPEAIVVSMTAFHGRGFFTGSFSPGDPQAYAAAIEALIGLIIEVSFIATFTQRFFGK